MSFVFAGYDQQGRPLYTQAAPQQTPQPLESANPLPKVRKAASSIFDRFFLVQDGLISFSLQSMTVLVGGWLVVMLVYMLTTACSGGLQVCDLSAGKFPTISRTIMTNEQWNKMFLITTSVFCWGVLSSMVRSFYKMLHGRVSVSTNNWYMFFGFLIVFDLPLIGVLDVFHYVPWHGICGGIFFGSTGVYFALIGNALGKHIDTYPEEKRKAIKLTQKLTYGIYVVLALFLYASIYCTKGW